MKLKGLILAVILATGLYLSENLLAYSGGDGDPDNPYQITDLNDFLQLTTDPNNWNKSFILTTDIDLTGLTFTNAPIAMDTDNSNYGFDGTAFSGIFDGKHHKIINFSIVGGNNSNVGLFGCISPNSQIKNLGLEIFTISGDYSVGGLCGANYSGTILTCYTTGDISGSNVIGGLCGTNYSGIISDCHATGTVSGSDDSIGGLCGINSGSGTITNCYAAGVVTGNGWCIGGLCGGVYSGTISACYATGNVSGYNEIGGLCGCNYQEGIITSCYATGAVTGNGWIGGLCGDNLGTISTCYATGTVTGGDRNIGGLCGGRNYGTTIDSFWNIKTSGQIISAGGTGKTTAEMKTLSTYISAEWDFTEVWAIGNGQTYPYLKPITGINPADMNYSGTVNMQDLAILATNWLAGI